MNTDTNTKRTAVVTGGSRGIGRAIALRLAADGLAVVVHYASNDAAAAQTVAAIEAAGGQALAVRGDVGDAGDVARLFDAAQEVFGGVHVVVNSAGIAPVAKIAPVALEDFDRTIATNLRGAFLVLGEAAARLREGGRIVVLSSSASVLAMPGYGLYVASKAGVEGMVRVLANELRGRRITVNAVAPGPVGTDLLYEGKSAEQIARMAALPPLERLGTPEDIAGVVSFLVGPEGEWVNGQVLRANGGFA